MEKFVCMDADGHLVSSGLCISLSSLCHAQHYVLFQSGVSPPILPCIHAELSHDLVAALVENPHSEELTVTIAIIIPLLLSSHRTVPTLFFAGRCCARTGGFDEQAWPK